MLTHAGSLATILLTACRSFVGLLYPRQGVYDFLALKYQSESLAYAREAVSRHDLQAVDRTISISLALAADAVSLPFLITTLLALSRVFCFDG